MGQAELVVRNARVYTLDPRVPWAGAVAVSGGRITWVGADADAGEQVAADTEVIDAGGRLVLPGFVDSHNHVRLGSDADCVQLSGAGSVAEVRARIAAWLGNHGDAGRRDSDGGSSDWNDADWGDSDWGDSGWGDSGWVEGEGLDYAAIRPGPGDLDGVTGGRPAFLFDYSGHGAWVNGAAMRRLGISATADRVPFGVIDKDPRTGEPTG